MHNRRRHSPRNVQAIAWALNARFTIINDRLKEIEEMVSKHSCFTGCQEILLALDVIEAKLNKALYDEPQEIEPADHS